MKNNKKFITVLKNLVDYAAINTCLHEETYRGGCIWEICSSCGAKWADDEGGKPKNIDYPKPILDAFKLLEELEEN